MTDHGKQLVLRRFERATTYTQVDRILEELGADYHTDAILAAAEQRKRELK